MCSTIASSGDVLIDRDGLFPSPVISVSSARSLGGKLASRQDEQLALYDKFDKPLLRAAPLVVSVLCGVAANPSLRLVPPSAAAAW